MDDSSYRLNFEPDNLGKLQGKIDGISYSHTFILFFSDSTEHYGKDIVLVTAATHALKV